MLNFCYMIVVACRIYHVSSAGKLTRQCKESYGKCGVTTDVSCNRMFGPGWVEKGKCCNSRPCCVESNFSCDTGYELRGNQSTTCTGDGWGYLPICVVQCGEIQQIPNGKMTKTGTAIGSTATFSCDTGYELRWSQSTTCTGDGWGYLPICYGCPSKTTFHFNGSTYTIPCRYLYSIDAEDHCKGQGGNLASIETEEENNYLKYVAKLIPGVSYWIGLSDRKTEGSFQWISSQQLTFTDWYQGPPIQPDDKTIYFQNTWDADCVLLNQEHSYQWSDETCDQIGAYAICEFWSVLSF